jgi:hypothetical protein
MAQLAVARPVFHSEADFQHALAWQIHKVAPNVAVRLEYRALPRTRFDIWLWREDGPLAIELKYKTKRLAIEVAGELFRPTNQAAHNLGRYDFVSDIARLERVTQSYPGSAGWAIILTNDDAYWGDSGRRDSIDAGFRLCEGRTLGGTHVYAGNKTIQGREQSFKLEGTYPVHWRDYSVVACRSGGKLRYLLVEV